MFKPATYQNVWLRRVPPDWKGRTDIRPSVIENMSITIAIFALPDSKFLFIPLAAIREVVAGIDPGKNGSVPFNIDEDSQTLTSKLRKVKAKMEMNHPKGESGDDWLADAFKD